MIKDRGIQPFHVAHNTPHYTPPPPPPSFAQALSSISLRTTVNTQEKLEKMVMQRGMGEGWWLNRSIMGNAKMVSYHPSDHFFLTNRDLFWARQSHLGLQRLHHLP